MARGTSSLRVDAARFRADFEALARIGATDDGGIHRPSLGSDHLRARAWFLERAAAAGLECCVDAAGNRSAILRFPGASKTLLLGSHLDSVPYGGKYDGPLGVLAALEVLRVVQEAGVDLAVNLEAIDFTDEEGTLVGLLGSQAVAGLLSQEALEHPRGGRAAFRVALQQAHLDESRLHEAQRDPDTLAGYLELHIEQGPRLERAGASIGIVTEIIGSRSFWVTFHGAANHAGTTPMWERADAGVGASAFVGAVHETVLERYPECVATVGQMTFEPGAFNIIPAQARLSLEFRSADLDSLDALGRELLDTARWIADEGGLDVTWQSVAGKDPVAMHPRVQEAIARSTWALDIDAVWLTSGAGHDAHPMAHVTPAGMIFVPSVGGISHQADEYTVWEDCVQGANVLLGAALLMAGHIQG